jgi:hypothetical protein
MARRRTGTKMRSAGYDKMCYWAMWGGGTTRATFCSGVATNYRESLNRMDVSEYWVCEGTVCKTNVMPSPPSLLQLGAPFIIILNIASLYCYHFSKSSHMSSIYSSQYREVLSGTCKATASINIINPICNIKLPIFIWTTAYSQRFKSSLPGIYSY